VNQPETHPRSPIAEPAPADVDVDALVEALAESWRLGDRASAESILAAHPGLDDESAIRLVFEEACLRRESGLEVATSEVVRRFPAWGDELAMLLRVDRLMRPPALAAFPESGERLGDFDLIAELGRGGSGRTFLASQPALAGRPVVLKLTPGHLDEHLSLASLQHTHIVPLYSAQLFADRGLRGLCMPYLGGASLARVLAELAPIEPARRTGRDLLGALDRTRDGAGSGPPPPGPIRRSFERASYTRSIAWVGACLADALQYAHDRGLVHMDVKPSNVLIADDGQPMLLDFHLARGPVEPGGADLDRLGGTPGWMAPEQAEAMAAIGEGRPVETGVDGRADIYALGRLLHHALGGESLGAVEGKLPRLDRLNPRVSVGLADIVEKCLRLDPLGRYANPGALADDLRRHLDDQPLRGVPNRSIAERWRKWRRRRPRALARGSAGLSTLAASVVALAVAAESYRHRGAEVDAALADAKRQRLAGQFAEAIHSADRGAELARALPGSLDRARALGLERRLAGRGETARKLHELADLLRFRQGSDLADPNSASAIERRCRRLWDDRAILQTSAEGPDDEATRRRVFEDLVELATAWADLTVRLAPPEAIEPARREALRILDEAATIAGPTPALARERHALARALGIDRSDHDPIPPPRSAWEHRELGRSLLREGRLDQAAAELRRATDLDPRDFWANFHRGACDYRLGRFEAALGAFRVCVALEPDSAECYYNRGLAAEATGRPEDAALDYTRALERDPSLAPAALNRGILAYRAGRHHDAIEDFRRALESKPTNATRAAILFNLALAQVADRDPEAARATLDQAARLGHDQARALRDRLQAEP
jgi:serine/threonine protein kinase/Flp pilus assembly protein TadD